jgi:protein gp37
MSANSRIEWTDHQCVAARVPFLFKQWGSYRWVAGPGRSDPAQRWEDHGIAFQRCPEKLAGRMLNGRTWDQFPAAEDFACSPADAVTPAGRTPCRAER